MKDSTRLDDLEARVAQLEGKLQHGWVESWQSIAEQLGDITPQNARQLALRKRDPLPVFFDMARNTVRAHAAALREWRARQMLPYQAARRAK
jgi:hypothetical protein